MTHIAAMILGFVEGATEFIPVSSSGHLIIARQLLGVNGTGGLAFDAVLQLATSCALLVYFWHDVVHLIGVAWRWLTRQPVDSKEKILLFAIILGTIPAVILGLLLQKQMDTIFRNVKLVALALVLGSLLFWWAQHIAKKYFNNHPDLTVKKGIIIGFYQCLALIPGVSRSGATISGGLFSGLSQEQAVRFSFLLSLPILFGAGFKELWSVRHDLLTTGYGSSLLLGSVVAFIVGLLSIRFLIHYLKNHDLTVFIWYRIALSIAIFLIF